MFTRIQTVYLSLALIFLCLGLFTSTIFVFDNFKKPENKYSFKISGFATEFKISKPVSTISDDYIIALRSNKESSFMVENNVFTWNGVVRHWFFVPGIASLLLLLMGFMNYKKPTVQLKFVRISLFMGILLLGLLIFASKLQGFFVEFSNKYEMLGNTELSLHLAAGYFFLVIHVPFIFLAQLSIKRDKKLLDSLNRLR
jgi:Domain of unknown function (DUF4293)